MSIVQHRRKPQPQLFSYLNDEFLFLWYSHIRVCWQKKYGKCAIYGPGHLDNVPPLKHQKIIKLSHWKITKIRLLNIKKR